MRLLGDILIVVLVACIVAGRILWSWSLERVGHDRLTEVPGELRSLSLRDFFAKASETISDEASEMQMLNEIRPRAVDLLPGDAVYDSADCIHLWRPYHLAGEKLTADQRRTLLTRLGSLIQTLNDSRQAVVVRVMVAHAELIRPTSRKTIFRRYHTCRTYSSGTALQLPGNWAQRGPMAEVQFDNNSLYCLPA